MIVQIFHSSFAYVKEDFDYQIGDSKSSQLTPKDFLYFLKVIIGNEKDHTFYETSSELIELTQFENETIYLQWNNQFLLNYDILKYYDLKVSML